MTPILVEPLSEQAYELLRQLEALHVLRVINTQHSEAVSTPTKPSVATLIGSLSPATGERMAKEVTEMRNEWEREY